MGDDELAAFCQREYPRLVAAMRLMTGDAVIAEDLAQEALREQLQEQEAIDG